MNKFFEAKEMFAKIFYLEKQWSNRGDRWFSRDGLTTKQWFFLAIVGGKFKYPPTIKELAKAMNTSHQNIKAIALKLEKSEFIKLETDLNDKRVKRIIITENADGFFKEREKEVEEYILNLFKDIELTDIVIAHRVISKLIDNVEGEFK